MEYSFTCNFIVSLHEQWFSDFAKVIWATHYWSFGQGAEAVYFYHRATNEKNFNSFFHEKNLKP